MNRTATVRFAATGDTVNIKQELVSSDAEGYMRMTTTVNGNIPTIPAGAKMEVESTKEEYRRVSPGVVKSYSTHNYAVDGIRKKFTVDQTITFKVQDQMLHCIVS